MNRPKIVVLSGSTRFRPQFEAEAQRLTLEGCIVLMPHIWVRSDPEYADITPEAKLMLDELHLHKIDLSNEMLVINVGGYFGASTRKEIEYAMRIKKPVMYLEPVVANRQTGPEYTAAYYE